MDEVILGVEKDNTGLGVPRPENSKNFLAKQGWWIFGADLFHGLRFHGL